MKKVIFVLFFASAVLAAEAQVQLTNGCVTLGWTNPNPAGLTDAVCLYHSTNAILPFTNWVKIATAPGDTTNAQVNVPAGVHFFTLTLSNGWGETVPCNIVGTPAALASATGLRITSLSLTLTQ